MFNRIADFIEHFKIISLHYLYLLKSDNNDLCSMFNKSRTARQQTVLTAALK